MLLESMNEKEITAQLQQEYRKILDTTLPRISHEYEKERKKLKIDKTRTYHKEYCIKTAGKNSWMIFVGKQPSVPKFKDAYSTYQVCCTYYHTKKGLQIFVPEPTQTLLMVYYGHFFKRYNERLHLNLPDTLAAVKHYFKNNIYLHADIWAEKEHIYAVAITKYGLMLGNVMYENKWVLWKTFVSRDLLRKDQDEMEIELITQLQAQIAEKLEKNEPYDKMKLQNTMSILYALTDKNIVE